MGRRSGGHRPRDTRLQTRHGKEERAGFPLVPGRPGCPAPWRGRSGNSVCSTDWNCP